MQKSKKLNAFKAKYVVTPIKSSNKNQKKDFVYADIGYLFSAE